jgi:hypothetical protein
VATEKTWNDPDVNRPHFAASTSTADQVRGFLWYVKAWLTGQIGGATRGLWTVVGSSDGATAGMDGVDRWGAVYDGTKLIRAAAGNAHSWMVLRSPGITAGGLTSVPFYMIIEWSASDVAPTFYGCKALPTGGTITARPTSTDETLNFGPRRHVLVLLRDAWQRHDHVNSHFQRASRLPSYRSLASVFRRCLRQCWPSGHGHRHLWSIPDSPFRRIGGCGWVHDVGAGNGWRLTTGSGRKHSQYW